MSEHTALTGNNNKQSYEHYNLSGSPSLWAGGIAPVLFGEAAGTRNVALARYRAGVSQKARTAALAQIGGAERFTPYAPFWSAKKLLVRSARSEAYSIL